MPEHRQSLHVLDRGDRDPLVMLHGFTSSIETWAPLIAGLECQRRVLAIDLIGHGASPAPAALVRYQFDNAVHELAQTVASLGIDRAAWLGYSLGGRLALALAIRHPDLVSNLILESATPGIRQEAEREDRRLADNALADRIERIGTEAFVAAWERLPMWESQRSLPMNVRRRQTALRLRNHPVGLANSLRGMGQGVQPSLWHDLPHVGMAVLLIAGILDGKFADIAREMHDLLPDSQLVLVPAAGHAVHLEQPARFLSSVEAFLSRPNRGSAVMQQERVR